MSSHMLNWYRKVLPGRGVNSLSHVQVSMAPGETVAERARTDLPASKHLLLVVCTLLECLPFLEGSSDAAVNILSELIKGTAYASCFFPFLNSLTCTMLSQYMALCQPTWCVRSACSARN